MELALKQLREATQAYDLVALERALRDAVPEFKPVESVPDHSATVVEFPGRRVQQS